MRLSIYLFLILPLALGATLREYVLSLGSAGSVRYIYNDDILLHIDRLSLSDEVLYRHSYVYDEKGCLLKETMIGDLGEIVYENPGIVRSPYHLEICEYDASGNLIRHTQDDLIREYVYSDSNELLSGNVPQEICEYDVDGNMIRKGDTYFCYDEACRLTDVISNEYDITYIYDEKGKRITRASNGEIENYAYFGINELAVFDEEGNVKELRIPGLSSHKDLFRSIAIETQDAIYAPIHDVQHNIVKLINIKTKEVISLTLAEPFGEKLSQNAPTRWLFAGKPFDKEANLVYFGNRYYSSSLHQWLSIDPAHQTSNLYQYCFHNPMKYFDPDGQFAIAIPLIWMGGAALTEVLIDAAIVGSAAWFGHKAIKKGNEWADKRDMQRNKKGDIDPTLPKDPFKDPRLEDISHPKAQQKGHYQFKDKKTGKILQYDKGKPGESGHEGQDHYHRPNPNSTGDKDKYLDGKGNPVPKGSDTSHLYPANSGLRNN